MARDVMSSLYRPGGSEGVEDSFQRLEQQADATAAERALAACARALQRRSMDAGAMRTAQTAMLQLIANGIEGPIGQVVAHAALARIQDCSDAGNARSIGYAALATIGDQSTSASEALLAKTVNQAASRRMPSPMAAAARVEGLKLIEAGISGIPEKDMADYGTRMAAAVTDAGNARDIGYDLLETLGKNAKDPALGSLAEAAWEATGQELTHATGLKAQQEAFGLIAAGANGRTGTQVVAEFGKRASNLSSLEVEGARLGRSVLESIATKSIKKEEQLYAAAAHRLSSSRESDYDSITIQNVAFDRLAAGVSGTPERVLAELGLDALGATRDTRNARSMGEVVIETIVTSASDDSVRKSAEKARRKSSGGAGLIGRVLGRDPDAAAVNSIREGLQGIKDAISRREAAQQAVRDEKNMEEIKKMADALAPEPKPADVKVEDKEVVIGGIRIARRPPRQETSAPSGEGEAESK